MKHGETNIKINLIPCNIRLKLGVQSKLSVEQLASEHITPVLFLNKSQP